MKYTIVYTSNAGHTREYAMLLSEKTGTRAYDLKTEGRNLDKGTEIIYMGWLMAGQVKGYREAARRFQIRAVAGVGMAKTGSQLTDIRRANGIGEDIPVFSLQGGFELEKLHGIYKVMMGIMKKTAGKGLQDKKDRTEEEDEMLRLMLEGGNMVSEENLTELMNWMEGEES